MLLQCSSVLSVFSWLWLFEIERTTLSYRIDTHTRTSVIYTLLSIVT